MKGRVVRSSLIRDGIEVFFRDIALLPRASPAAASLYRGVYRRPRPQPRVSARTRALQYKEQGEPRVSRAGCVARLEERVAIEHLLDEGQADVVGREEGHDLT